MRISHSHEVDPGPADQQFVSHLQRLSEAQLREWLNRLSAPRNFFNQPDENKSVAKWLAESLANFGFKTRLDGEFNNVIALPRQASSEIILVGAHYDTVATTPGADDNGSAVAAMLGAAFLCAGWKAFLPIGFVAFNCEEDGLLGSKDFVQRFLQKENFQVNCAHILEMVGYASDLPGSQKIPTGLPIKLNDKGNFLGLLANAESASFADPVLAHAQNYGFGLPVTALTVPQGAENFLPVLKRSDHAPFWANEIPSVLWTDTAEFRNPNYHQPGDLPSALNFNFLRKVTQLLAATVIHQAEQIEN